MSEWLSLTDFWEEFQRNIPVSQKFLIIRTTCIPWKSTPHDQVAGANKVNIQKTNIYCDTRLYVFITFILDHQRNSSLKSTKAVKLRQYTTIRGMWFTYHPYWGIFSVVNSCIFCHHINGLLQERRNSIASALELRLSCINSSICSHIIINLNNSFDTILWKSKYWEHVLQQGMSHWQPLLGLLSQHQ